MREIIIHFNASMNLIITVLLISGYIAIRRGRRDLHPRFMLSAFGFGVLFLIGYVIQVIVSGHGHFPGDDWVRKLFLGILLTHTLCAVVIVPLILRTLYLAFKKRFEAHRRLAPFAFGLWLYVSVTGVVIYWMNTYVRPSL